MSPIIVIRKNTKIWIRGIIATIINGFASGVVLIVADPVAFNLDAGLRKLVMTSTVFAIMGLANYLKQHPLPDDEDVVAITGNGRTLGAYLLPLLLVSSLAAGCAGNPRSNLVKTHQGIQTILAALDDAERRLCFGSTTLTATPNQCHTDVAKAVGLTDARHRAIHAALNKGYEAQIHIGAAIALWQPGQTVDMALALQAASEVNSILAAMNVKMPDLTPLLQRAKDWTDQLERLKQLFGGGSLEVAYGY